jgi:hypothetical protein
VVLVEQKEDDFFRIWKLNEAEKYEIWCELRTSGLTEKHPVVAVNNAGLIMVINDTINMSIFDSKGKLILKMTFARLNWAGKMPLPGLRTSQRPVRVSVTAIESNNLWPPEYLSRFRSLILRFRSIILRFMSLILLWFCFRSIILLFMSLI